MNVVLAYKGRYVIRQALDLEMLAAVLRREGHAVRLTHDPGLFGETDNVLQIPSLARRLSSPDRTAQRIAALKPDAVLFSVLPSTVADCLDAARRVRARVEAPIVFLGLHPTLTPEAAIRQPCVDYVIEGEAEEAAPALLRRLSRGSGAENLNNVWSKEGGVLQHGALAPPLDMDALPYPDKDLFAPYVNHRFSYAAMVSRGCPFSCTYCEETCLKNKYGPGWFRRRGVESILSELSRAKQRYGFGEVIFKDSYLSGDEDWLERLMDGYARRIARPFKCFCTVSGFTGQTARLLKRGGCYGVEFGLQTWNASLRRRILNRRETNAQAREVFELCASHGLWFDVDHMFNLPGESEDDHRRGALEYLGLERLNRIKVHYLVYLPTAPIVDKGLEAGVLDRAAVQSLNMGAAGDFYTQDRAEPGQAEMTAAYAALYKLLPLLPPAAVHRILDQGMVKHLADVPAPLMAALQGVRAVQTRDWRFAVYARQYPAQAVRELLRRVARP